MTLFRSFVTEWKTKDPKGKVWMALGGLFLVATLIAIALPIVPQVPFAMAAAYFFSKGSPALHHWIRSQKHIGQAVSDWEDHRAVRPRLKIISTVAMIGGAAIGHWRLHSPWYWGLDAAFAMSILFVWTRRSLPRV